MDLPRNNRPIISRCRRYEHSSSALLVAKCRREAETEAVAVIQLRQSGPVDGSAICHGRQRCWRFTTARLVHSKTDCAGGALVGEWDGTSWDGAGRAMTRQAVLVRTIPREQRVHETASDSRTARRPSL